MGNNLHVPAKKDDQQDRNIPSESISQDSVTNLYRRCREEISLAYRRISSGAKMAETTCGLIQYTEFGDGHPMLVVHTAGGYDRGEYFARLIGGNYHWIALSRFGFLGMPIAEGANSSMQADAYASLLDYLENDHGGVVGVSMGGLIESFDVVYPQLKDLDFITQAPKLEVPVYLCRTQRCDGE